MNQFLGKFISKIIDSFPLADLEWLETRIRQMLLKKKTADYRLASFLNWQKLPVYWSDYLPPWRPSKGDFKNYEESISALPRNSRILILGATPELRDLVATFGFKPVVADFSLPMLIEMLQYTKEADADNEIWVKSDWLEAPINGNFDVILGDMVLEMVGVGRQGEFLKKIKNFLSPQGIFITRLHFVDESLFELADKEILDEAVGILDEKLAANVLSRRIRDRFSDTSKNIIYRGKAIECMKEAVKRAKGSREKMIFSQTLEFLRGEEGRGFMFDRARWTSQGKTQLEDSISKFFDITDIKMAADYPDSKFYPIYILKSEAGMVKIDL